MKKFYFLSICLVTCLLITACSLFGGKSDQASEGKSAYELAVENGFVGTEGEWIASLTGPSGPSGNTPHIRINEETRLWEVSYDNGISWISLNFDSTSGQKGDAGVGIESIGIDYRGYACITLTNGEIIEVKIEESCKHSNISETITYPTCKERGFTTHECMDCGMIYLNKYTEKTGHHFVDKCCTVCNLEEPFGEIPISTEWYTAYPTNTTYQISNREQLAGFAYLVNNGTNFSGKTVALTADIDLGDNEWIPIGNTKAAFAGTFDGHYFNIYGLKISNQKNNLGLFGYVTGIVKRVNVLNANINVDDAGSNIGIAIGYTTNVFSEINVSGFINAPASDYVGGVAGNVAISGNFTFDSCKNEAIIIGKNYIGGIAGCWNDILSSYYNSYTLKITNMENIADISGADYVGGIVGYIKANNPDSGSISITASDFKNSGNIVAGTYVGGIFGYAFSDTASTLTNATNNASVTADAIIGGIAGKVEGISLSNSSNDGTTLAVKRYILENGEYQAYAGGYIGLGLSCSITNCHNSTEINYNSRGFYIGGIAGYLNGAIKNVSNTAKIYAPDSCNVAGIAGKVAVNGNYTYTLCENSGEITGFENVGGIIGHLNDHISNYYNNYTLTVNYLKNNANIKGVNNVGGIFGNLYAENTDTYSIIITANDLTNSGNVTGTLYVGGVSGIIYSDTNRSTIQNATSNATITADAIVGGIAGKIKNISLKSCSNKETSLVVSKYIVDSGIYKAIIGGYVGLAEGDSSIINCHNESDITYSSKGNFIGGIVGYISGYVQDVSNIGDINAPDSSYVGGVAGKSDSNGNRTLSNITNNGKIVGLDYVGGIIGEINDTISDYYNGYTLTINNIQNFADVQGANYVGGIFGKLNANNYDRYSVMITASDIANSGNVSGKTVVGGLFGYVYSDTNASTLKGSTNTGTVSGDESFGDITGSITNLQINED